MSLTQFQREVLDALAREEHTEHGLYHYTGAQNIIPVMRSLILRGLAERVSWEGPDEGYLYAITAEGRKALAGEDALVVEPMDLGGLADDQRVADEIDRRAALTSEAFGEDA